MRDAAARPEEPTPSGARRAPRPRLGALRAPALSRELAVLLLILATCLLASLLSPYFLSVANLRNVLIASSTELVVAAGMTVVLVSGGIDLSVGSTIGVAAITAALLFDAGWDTPAAIAAAAGVGVAVGLLNGALIAYANLNPLITTLGTMTIGRSVVFILSGGYALSAIPPGLKHAFNAEAALGMPNLVWAALAVSLVLDQFMRRNVWLRRFYFLGGSEVAAIRAGIATRRLKLAAYVISGLLASFAAVMTIARMGSAFPNTGTGIELRVITAVVVGGCSIYGGRGTVLGAALGVLFLNLVSNVLVILSLSVYWQGVAAGCVLILAVLTDMAGQRGRR